MRQRREADLRAWLVLRDNPPKIQHMVIFQTTETRQLPFIRRRWKTHKQLPFFCRRMKSHNFGYGGNPNSKSCRAENTEKKENTSPLNEFKLRGMVNLVKRIPPQKRLVHEDPITRGKREAKISTESQVSEHTIKVYSNLSCCIHADVNKRQITGRKNNQEGISP